MKQFDQGKKYLFLQALDVFESQDKWDEAYDSCRQALCRKDEGGLPSYLGADWRVWKTFIAAASKKPNPQVYVDLRLNIPWPRTDATI
jgi:N-terminal acetyltransferase B complex non-catalytic subunit